MKESVRSFVVRILTEIAKLVVKKYHPRIILVTGSVGKTSTKDAIYAALAPHTFVRKSEKNYNGDIGVPLTILGVPNGWSNPWIWLHNIVEGLILLIVDAPYPEWLILEVGADRPGDISKSLSWLEPHIVVATRFPDIPVHVEFYKSTDDVRAEEISPVGWLQTGGILVGNGDDEYVRSVSLPAGAERIMYGIDTPSNVYADNIEIEYVDRKPAGMKAEIHFDNEHYKLALPGVVGKSYVLAALGGITTAISMGVSLKDAVAALSSLEPTPGRMRILKGERGTTLIDDSYNASPIAVEEALKALGRIHAKRRVAVLGDMLELGTYSAASHEMIGELVPGNADVLVTVGPRARAMGLAAIVTGMQQNTVYSFEKSTEAAAFLMKEIQSEDVILIKGSQSVRTEKIVRELMLEKTRAEELTARSSPEWLMR